MSPYDQHLDKNTANCAALSAMSAWQTLQGVETLPLRISVGLEHIDDIVGVIARH